MVMSSSSMESPKSLHASRSRAWANPGFSFRQLPKVLCYHMYTFYLTISNNLWDIVIGGFLYGVINSCAAPRFMMGPVLSWSQILSATPAMLLWSFSNIFMFCLHNQRQPGNIEEDKLNKPWRPIASGRLTSDQALRLLYFMHPFCFVIAIYIGGFVPYAVLTFFHVWYNEFGGAANGVVKNIFNGIGIGCFFAGPLEVATGYSVFSGKAEGAIWVGILMATFGATSHVQDFRDMQGDRAANRSTIPLVVGEMTARVLAIAAVGFWTEVACQFWSAGWLQRALPYATGAVLVANLLLDRTHDGDVRAWRLWSVWVLSLFLLPVF